VHDVFAQVLQVGFFAALIRIATPLILATLGELFAERSGVLNLGIEGIMLFSAMTGFTAAYFSGDLWIGIAAAAATGAAMGLLMALMTVTLGVSQHVSGIGVTLLCSGFAFYFYRLIFGEPSQPPNIEPFKTLPIPGLRDIPVLGPILFSQFALSYVAFAAVAVAAFVLSRTPWGLNLRTVGENPRAADAAGVNVAAMRYQALLLSGALMGVAGAYLAMAQFNAFTFGVISGRGWVCIALVVFGQWRPWRSALGALLFALIDALQLRLQASGIISVPYQIFLMMPFVLTIVAMAAVSRNARAPAALLTPFRKEER
jgi:simple sugar transport system permease protein